MKKRGKIKGKKKIKHAFDQEKHEIQEKKKENTPTTKKKRKQSSYRQKQKV